MQARKCLVLCLVSVVSATWIFPGQRRCSATSSSCSTTTSNRKRHSAVSVHHKGNLDNDRFFQSSDSANRLTPGNRLNLNSRRSTDVNTYGLKIPAAVSSNSPFRSTYISSDSAPHSHLRPSIYRSERRAFRPSLYLVQSATSAFQKTDPSQRDSTIPPYDNVPITTTPKPFPYTYAHGTSHRYEYPSPRPFSTSSPYKYVTPTPRYQPQSLRYSPGRQHSYKKSVTTTSTHRQPKVKGGSYEYRYDVNSFYHGATFRHQEHSNGETVHGEYRVRLPDGRLQIVSYTADHENGFVPSIRYEGSQTNQAANIHFQPPH